MTYFEDLTRYRYVPGSDTALNVGWLHPDRPFPVGHVPDGLVERLARLAVEHPTNRMMGWHPCRFCDAPFPVEIVVDEVVHPVGDAEIWVSGPDATYATPTLVVHYTAVHRYRPPDGFIAAVMADRRADS